MRTLAIFCIFLATCHAALEDFFLVRNSVIKDLNDLGRVNDASAEDCAARCMAIQNCHSFEYKAEHNKCDLSSYEVAGQELIRSPYGWEIYSMYPIKRKLDSPDGTSYLDLYLYPNRDGYNVAIANYPFFDSNDPEDRDRVAELEASVAADTQGVADLEETLRSLQANIERTERLLQNATSEMDGLVNQRDQLAEDTDTLVALLQSSNETLSEILVEYQELIESKTDLDQTIEQHNAQLSQLEASAATLRGSGADKDKVLKTVYSEKAKIEGDLAEINSAVSILQNHVTKLNKLIALLEKDLDAADDPEVYVARNCYELYKLHDVKESGVYDIYPFGPNGKVVKAFCDMRDGGGWTVIQRRDIARGCKLSFSKTWNDYKNGFGSASGEYWLGNDAIASLTVQRNELKVYVKNEQGQLRFSHYRDFQMGKQSQNYNLRSVTYRTGNAGDQMSYLRGRAFGTKDRENNNARCSGAQGGGFWFKTDRYCSKKGWWGSCSRYSNRCSSTNINGLYPRWSSTTTSVVMRIRPQ